MDQSPAIEIQRLGKRLSGRSILEQVSMRVERGQVVGLLGPNGAGKTTLLRCLTGALVPDYGRCLINGLDPRLDGLRARAQFGYLPDVPPLEDDLRVEEYLRLHARLAGIGGARQRSRIDTVLHLVELADRRRQLVGTLSRGQRSRLGLAQTLLAEAPVLILDEPTAGLDPAQVVALRGLLRRIAHDRAVLLATHHLAEAEAVCHALVVLVDGRVRFHGRPADLAHDSALEAAYLTLAGAGA